MFLARMAAFENVELINSRGALHFITHMCTFILYTCVAATSLYNILPTLPSPPRFNPAPHDWWKYNFATSTADVSLSNVCVSVCAYFYLRADYCLPTKFARFIILYYIINCVASNHMCVRACVFHIHTIKYILYFCNNNA